MPARPGRSGVRSIGGGLEACSPRAPGADCANADVAAPQQLGLLGGSAKAAGAVNASAAVTAASAPRAFMLSPFVVPQGIILSHIPRISQLRGTNALSGRRLDGRPGWREYCAGSIPAASTLPARQRFRSEHGADEAALRPVVNAGSFSGQWYRTTRIRLPSCVQTGPPQMSDEADSRARTWTRLPSAVTVSRRRFSGQPLPQRSSFVPAT
jgi:hypothetical protein